MPYPDAGSDGDAHPYPEYPTCFPDGPASNRPDRCADKRHVWHVHLIHHETTAAMDPDQLAYHSTVSKTRVGGAVVDHLAQLVRHQHGVGALQILVDAVIGETVFLLISLYQGIGNLR